MQPKPLTSQENSQAPQLGKELKINLFKYLFQRQSQSSSSVVGSQAARGPHLDHVAGGIVRCRQRRAAEGALEAEAGAIAGAQLHKAAGDLCWLLASRASLGAQNPR